MFIFFYLNVQHSFNILQQYMIARDMREFGGMMEMINVLIVVDCTYLSKLIKLYLKRIKFNVYS